MAPEDYRRAVQIGAVPIGVVSIGAAPTGAARIGAARIGAASTGPEPTNAGPVGAGPVGTAPRGSVPDNWFVDPVRLGVPGVRQIETSDADENQLSWQSDSLCAQTDPEAFFPEKGGSTRDAKKICTSCEVRNQCLEYALANDERFGIWGGLSERERRKLRKRA